MISSDWRAGIYVPQYHQAAIRQNEPVDLQEQPSFQLGGRPLSPNEGTNRRKVSDHVFEAERVG